MDENDPLSKSLAGAAPILGRGIDKAGQRSHEGLDTTDAPQTPSFPQTLCGCDPGIRGQSSLPPNKAERFAP